MHPVSRYWYLVPLIIIGTAVFLFYRTEAPTITAEFGGVSLRIEYATTEAGRERGLGGRKSVPNDYGMLFVFPAEAPYGFWMKDMLVPIDMFWLNSQGQVVSIASNVATSTYPHVFYPTAPARYVLETAAGFANRYGIATGTPLELKNIPVVSE
ncbi:DUF192 domain-containing protein [Candidatus Parcubacteria bacterium]|nr:DUF192 domain-containing protein [Candidatus Parcubacteria bacterium]